MPVCMTAIAGWKWDTERSRGRLSRFSTSRLTAIERCIRETRKWWNEVARIGQRGDWTPSTLHDSLDHLFTSL